MSIAPSDIVNPRFEFCDRLRKIRRSVAKLNQTEMAAALGVNQKVYGSWEAGLAKPSDIVSVAQRIEYLWPDNVTAGWVLGVEKAAPPPPTITLKRRRRKADAGQPTDQSVDWWVAA